jgi:hypothetical protein
MHLAISKMVCPHRNTTIATLDEVSLHLYAKLACSIIAGNWDIRELYLANISLL